MKTRKPGEWESKQILNHGVAIAAYVKLDDWTDRDGNTTYDVDGEFWATSGNQTITLCADIEQVERVAVALNSYVRQLKLAQAWADRTKGVK